MDIASFLLPALVAAVAIFFTSFMLWMLVKPWHAPDIQPLPDEDALTSKLGELEIPPGFYMWPYSSPGDKEGAAAANKRLASGPWGTINILGSAPNFARNLACTFLVYFVTMWMTAFVIGMGAKPAAEFGDLFWPCVLMAGVVFSIGPLPVAFFHGKPTRYLLTDIVDGLIFAVIGSAILAAMWPAAA